MKLKKFGMYLPLRHLQSDYWQGGTGEKAEEGSTGGSKGGDTIKIGVNLELSGQVASYGTSELAGIELAVDEINAAGGSEGKEIELVKIDNKSDAAEATSAAIRLTTQDKVVATSDSYKWCRTVDRLKLQTIIRLHLKSFGTSPKM